MAGRDKVKKLVDAGAGMPLAVVEEVLVLDVMSNGHSERDLDIRSGCCCFLRCRGFLVGAEVGFVVGVGGNGWGGSGGC